MCFILTLVFLFAAFTFFSKGLMIQGLISGMIAAFALFFFIRKLLKNAPCIFGKDRDCNKR
ncbi:hypothetical protein [Sulfuricurvum sp.]|uniref:hypothetical protein n=1 Tax=Sulfuricurvum sp. TaxID=2025608 RepID=UPI002E30ED82|nr:hypothetical protein [Sulfuricurvum sp.]HEX5329041.1 hypothetical protein [Sulfuricurvum sp.]